MSLPWKKEPTPPNLAERAKESWRYIAAAVAGLAAFVGSATFWRRRRKGSTEFETSIEVGAPPPAVGNTKPPPPAEL